MKKTTWSPKEVKVITVAQNLFIKYGFRKVTMSEIAEAAEMSRPTLYSLHSNIEAVLIDLVQYTTAQNNEKTMDALRDFKGNLKDQLELLFEIWIIEPFARVIDSENARDLLQNCTQYAPVAIDSLYEQFEKHVLNALKPAMTKKNAMNANELARILTLATQGFKAAADDLPALKRLVKGLIAMTLASVDA